MKEYLTRLEHIQTFFEERGILPAHILEAKLSAWELKFKQLEKGDFEPWGKYYDLSSLADSLVFYETPEIQTEYDLMIQVTEDGETEPDLENTLENYWKELLKEVPELPPAVQERLISACSSMYHERQWTRIDLWLDYVLIDVQDSFIISLSKEFICLVSAGLGKKQNPKRFRPDLETWKGVVDAAREREKN